MKNLRERWVVGGGSPAGDLREQELYQILESALANVEPGKRVLAIIPDLTRGDPTPSIFPKVAAILSEKGIERTDVLVALGTHAPMPVRDKHAKIGFDRVRNKSEIGSIFDHRWDDPTELTEIGVIGAEEAKQLSGGLLDQEIRLTVNKRVASGEYDTILVFSSTVPHEVAGFSGGGKCFFPGVAGPELTHATHWLGALAKIENVIGKIDTPTRRLIDAAVEYIETPTICINSVVSRDEKDRLHTHAIFIGDVKTAFLKAAEVSRELHVKFVRRKYRRVVALLDDHYDELWVGGKASYKLGGVVAEGGELLIYAPHLNRVSATHGTLIEKYGYAPIETVREMVAGETELQRNLCVAAHLAHVSYAGRVDEAGSITPLYKITLASGLCEDTCRRLRLGYTDHKGIDLDAFRNDPETLVVPNAGRDLYMLG